MTNHPSIELNDYHPVYLARLVRKLNKTKVFFVDTIECTKARQQQPDGFMVYAPTVGWFDPESREFKNSNGLLISADRKW